MGNVLITLKAKIESRRGFTIVELLIVIVVIGILAAIVIVAYNSISRRAIESSIKADLKTAGTTLESEKTTSGSYPLTAAAANNGAGLKSSGANSLTYFSRPYGYCMTVGNTGAPDTYVMRSTIKEPKIGNCDVAITTYLGSTYGYQDGTTANALFHNPMDVAFDPTGNMYILDNDDQRVRKVTPAGVVSTLAGSGVAGFANGTGTAAQFQWPHDIIVDSSGNVFMSDRNNRRIRMITPAGVVTTIAGSGVQGYLDATGTAAQFNNPRGIVVDSAGNLFVADGDIHRIRKITPAGVVTTFAGSGVGGWADGTGTAAQLNTPNGIAIDSADNLYVTDSSSHRIRKITPTGVVTTVAGSGIAGYNDATGAAAQFAQPRGIVVDTGGTLYVSETGIGGTTSHRIRAISPAGVVSTIAGAGSSGYADGIGTAARFSSPDGMALDGAGNLYVADYFNNRVRKIAL